MQTTRLNLVALALALLAGSGAAAAVEESSQTRDRRLTNAAPITNMGYMTSLRANGNPHCGATLITPHHILTAAHCLSDLPAGSTVEAWVGGNDISGGSDWEVHSVANVNCHPDFDSETLAHDLCVLTLDRASSFKPVQLNLAVAQGTELMNEVAGIGAQASLLGWGATSSNGPANSQTLMRANTQVITDDACTSYYGASYQALGGICARNGCRGDSGGPLLTPDMSLQIGVVSYSTEQVEGDLCGPSEAPAAFVDIAEHTQFITMATLGALEHPLSSIYTVTDTTATENNNNSFMLYALIGAGALAAILAVVVVVLSCVICRRRAASTKAAAGNTKTGHVASQSFSVMGSPSMLSADPYYDFVYGGKKKRSAAAFNQFYSASNTSIPVAITIPPLSLSRTQSNDCLPVDLAPSAPGSQRVRRQSSEHRGVRTAADIQNWLEEREHAAHVAGVVTSGRSSRPSSRNGSMSRSASHDDVSVVPQQFLEVPIDMNALVMSRRNSTSRIMEV